MFENSGVFANGSGGKIVFGQKLTDEVSFCHLFIQVHPRKERFPEHNNDGTFQYTDERNYVATVGERFERTFTGEGYGYMAYAVTNLLM